MNTLPIIVCVFAIYIVGVLCKSDDPGDYYADIEYDKLHKSESTSQQYNSKKEHSQSKKQESSSKTNKEYSGVTYHEHTPGDYYEDIEYDKLPHNQHAAISKKASSSSSSSSSEEQTESNNDRRDHDPGSWYS